MIEGWTDLASHIDAMIRQSKLEDARSALLKIVSSEIPRTMIATFARLARRTRLNYLTLKILKPYIRPDVLFAHPATDEELALYAGALIRIGGRRQGLKILSKLDTTKTPEVLLFKMDALFTEWNYEKAIPILRQYIKSELISDYQRLVGRLNLAAALFFTERYDQALNQLVGLRADFIINGYHLLYANALEISAQISLAKKNFKEAKSELSLASQILKNDTGTYHFFIRKWQGIADFMQDPNSSDRVNKLDSLQIEANEMGDWEGVRHIDYYKALVTNNRNLYLYWIVGTPYKNYRKILTKAFTNPPPLPSVYRLFLGGGAKNIPKLDLALAEFKSSRLPQGGLPHQLLIQLLQDFYRPVLIGEAFSKLYENEYFDSDTSPERVRSVVRRLSAWFTKEKIPLAVRTNRQSLSIYATGPIEIVIRPCQDWIFKKSSRLQELKKNIKGKWFNIYEALDFVGLGVRSTQRLLRSMVKSGELQCIGSARSRRYRFKGPLQRQYHK